MYRKCLGFVLVVIFALGFVSLAEAATTGKITGRIVDKAGEALPGANVLVEGTTRGATTDEEGYYFILSVDPGSYTVKASMVGYTGETKSDVRVASDLTTTVDFSLNEAALELGELTVIAERPPVEADVTESRYVVTAEDIAVLPIIRDLDSFIELEAGVNTDGTNRIRNAFLGGDGGEVAAYVVDGVRLTHSDGRRGTGTRGGTQNWTGDVNTSAISEITVLAGGLNAEYGNTGSIQIVTKDGGRDYHGQFHYRYSPAQQKHWGNNAYESFVHQGRLQYGDSEWDNETANGRKVHQRPSSDYTDVQGHFLEASLSGPINRDLSFFATTKHDLQARNLPQPTEREPFNADVSYKLTYSATPDIKLRVGGLYSSRKGRYADSFDSRAIFLEERGPFGGEWQVTDNMFYVSSIHTLSAKTFYEVRLSYIASNQDTIDIPSTTVNPSLDNDGWYYTDPGQRRDLRVGQQNKLAARFDLASQVTRTHFLKGGFTFYRYDNWKTETFEDVDERNRWLIYWGKRYEPGVGITPTELHAYVQDKMEFEGLIINAGFRYERYSGGVVPLYPYQGAPMGYNYTRFRNHVTYGDMQPMNWFMPRVGISHPITAKSKIHFFYGKFHTRPDFRRIYQQNWRATGPHSIDHNNDGAISAEEYNNNLVRNDSFGAGFVIDQFFSLQHSQVSTAFELGTEWNFISDYSFQGTAYYRITNGFLSVNGAVFRDPQQGGKAKTRSQGPRGHTTTRGIELALKKGLKHNFSFKAALNFGWGERLTIGGTKRGNMGASIYPDASYIADPNRYWVSYTIDPNTGAEIPAPPTGAKLEELKAKAQEVVDSGLAGDFGVGAMYATNDGKFYPLWEQSGLSSEEQAALRGLYAFSTTGWSVEGGRSDATRTNGSLVLVYASPPDFGPGEMFWGSKLFGDVRVNMIYRIFTGRIFDFQDPKTSLNLKKEGPTISTVDFSFQKGFNIRGIRPLLYVEIENLFNFKGSPSTSADYVRWGLLESQPTNPLFVQFGGDASELSRFTRTNPRLVFAGLRLTW